MVCAARNSHPLNHFESNQGKLIIAMLGLSLQDGQQSGIIIGFIYPATQPVFNFSQELLGGFE